MKAINKAVGNKSSVIQQLETILEQTVISGEVEIEAIDEQIKKLQFELVNRATSSESYNDLADAMDELREKKKKIQVEIAMDKGRQNKREELERFLRGQKETLDTFDDGLVRRLIENITIHENGTYTVEFKSGTVVEV